MVTRDDTSAQARRRLRELQAEETLAGPSPRVEQRVMRAWDARHQRPVEGALWPHIRWVVATAAVVVIVGAAALRVRWVANSGTEADLPRATAQAVVEDDARTTVRTALARYETDPATLQVVLLRTDSATLSRMGVPLPDLASDASVALEVVLREDGTAVSARVLENVEERWP